MKTLYRNFLSIFRRFPASIVMNVVGLALALAAFIVIMMEMKFETTYDDHLKNAGRIFMLTRTAEDQSLLTTFPRPMVENLKSVSPEIEGCTYCEWDWKLQAADDSNQPLFQSAACGIAPDFFTMFSFDWITCDSTTFTGQLYIFIPESLALKYFHTTDLVGTVVKEENKDYGWTIGGVYRDFPENCSIRNMVYNTLGNAYKDNWRLANFFAYIMLKHPEKAEEVEQLLNGMTQTSSHSTIHLTPYPDVPYRTDLNTCNPLKLDSLQRYIYLAIALLIILTAAINFTNFYTALAPLRVRSLNTQRVLGAKRGKLIKALMAESVILGVLAFLLAVLVVKAVENSFVNDLLKVDISITAFPDIISLTGAVTLFISVTASLFPALYATSFEPAVVLKGNFGLSPRGKQWRNLLMGIQLTAAIGLLIIVGGLVCQNNYLRHSDLGYDQDRLITIDLYAAKIYDNRSDALAAHLQQLPCVEDVALSRYRLSAQRNDQIMFWTHNLDNGKRVITACLPVSANYLEVMGIRLIEGNGFNPMDHNSPMIFNKAACDLYPEIRAGRQLKEEEGNSPIVGICENFKMGSLREKVVPVCLKILNGPYSQWESKGIANIRIKDGIALEDAFEPIQKACTAFAPESIFELKTQFQLMENIYREEKRTQQNLTLFCLLSIIISLSGVFSMSLFECNYRRKEIGLRKIMGASTHSIIMMFFKQYALILLLSFIVAAPLGWYGVHRYLEGFAYKTPQHWWIYALSLLAISATTLLTVYFQCRKTAHDNPINAIRTE